MNEIDTNKINEAITKAEELIRLLKQLIQGVETVERQVESMDYYLAKSGNPTWRLYCEDGTQCWLRTSQEEMLRECMVWDLLNGLDMDDNIACVGTIKTVKDGDFHKVVDIITFSIVPGSSS